MKKLRRLFMIITGIFALTTVVLFILYIIARNTNGNVIIVDMELARK